MCFKAFPQTEQLINGTSSLAAANCLSDVKPCPPTYIVQDNHKIINVKVKQQLVIIFLTKGHQEKLDMIRLRKDKLLTRHYPQPVVNGWSMRRYEKLDLTFSFILTHFHFITDNELNSALSGSSSVARG